MGSNLPPGWRLATYDDGYRDGYAAQADALAAAREENERHRAALKALLALTVGSRHAGGEDDCRVCAAIVAARAALTKARGD